MFDDLYTTCPSCNGKGTIKTIKNHKNKDITCPLCRGTGKADIEDAVEWIDERDFFKNSSEL